MFTNTIISAFFFLFFSGHFPAQDAPAACPSIVPPFNGHYFGNCLKGYVGGTCQFSCNEGFKLNGSASIKCKSDATWSQPPPICSTSDCPSIGSPIGGFSDGTCAPGILNRRCLFSCAKGLKMFGNSSLLCVPGGLWSGTFPRCDNLTATAW